MTTAARSGDALADASTVVGPEWYGRASVSISVGDTHLASTTWDARSFGDVLKRRLAQGGGQGREGGGRR